MVKDNNFIKESSSIIEEIEAQLKDVLAKKKEQVKQELEEKIKAEQEEAQKRIDQIESELEGNKEAIENYKTVLSQFENDKEQIKGEIKEHLDKAIQLQTEIEEKTGQSLNELRVVSDLTKKLEVINTEATGKVNALKSELEDKYGIIAPVPESNGHDEVDFDLENELSKLQKIKELLGETVVSEKAKEEPKKEAESVQEEVPVEEVPAEELPETEEEAPPTEEDTVAEEALPDAAKTLEGCKKIEPIEEDGELVYYEKDNKQILDAKNLFDTLTASLDEAKRLYNKLTETESPKDQFFIKQEIIQRQDVLRKIMLSNIRLSEKDNCSLPKIIGDVVNTDTLKVILEKVSMENWSNQEDFSSFEKYMSKLADEFNTKVTSQEKYLDSILEELEIK
jgi:translation initiation factor 2 beta subunit (eIF-2beta)/eIF-5